MKYLYETHCHTNVISFCGKISPKEIVELYVKNGYTGVFIADHFLNGNCILSLKEEKDYKKQIHGFFEGYRQVKECGKGKLDVFPAFEYSYKGTDILVYGLDEDKLINMPEILDLTTKQFINYVKENGGITIQAHPFREAPYIDHIRLFTNTTGVEIINTSMKEYVNNLSEFYFNEMNNISPKIKTCGSDLHRKEQEIIGGISFETKVKSVEDFIDKLKNNEGTLFTKQNEYKTI